MYSSIASSISASMFMIVASNALANASISKNWAGFPHVCMAASLRIFDWRWFLDFSLSSGGLGSLILCPRVDRQGNPVWKPLVFILGGSPFEFPWQAGIG